MSLIEYNNRCRRSDVEVGCDPTWDHENNTASLLNNVFANGFGFDNGFWVLRTLNVYFTHIYTYAIKILVQALHKC